MSPDGKPIQIPASSLQAAAAQNAMGMLFIFRIKFFINIARIVNKEEDILLYEIKIKVPELFLAQFEVIQ